MICVIRILGGTEEKASTNSYAMPHHLIARIYTTCPITIRIRVKNR
jgi:hypothetical protein